MVLIREETEMEKPIQGRRAVVVAGAKNWLRTTRMQALRRLWKLGQLAEEATSPFCGEHTRAEFAADVGVKPAAVKAAEGE